MTTHRARGRRAGGCCCGRAIRRPIRRLLRLLIPRRRWLGSLRLQRGCGMRRWGRDGLGAGAQGRGREGAEGSDVDYPQLRAGDVINDEQGDEGELIGHASKWSVPMTSWPLSIARCRHAGPMASARAGQDRPPAERHREESDTPEANRGRVEVERRQTVGDRPHGRCLPLRARATPGQGHSTATGTGTRDRPDRPSDHGRTAGRAEGGGGR